MLQDALQGKLEEYVDICAELKKSLGWRADQNTIMLVAAMYITNSKQFDLIRFNEIADYIKSEVGMFSYLKSAQRFTTAATIDTSGIADPKEGFKKLLTIYEKLIERGFSRTTYTYIAAGTLLKLEQSEVDNVVQKAMDIYNGMKKHHSFLTSSGDYPLATLLALNEEVAEQVVGRTEDYYQTLQNKNFSKGNDLQFLSHILALDPNHTPEEMAEQCRNIKDVLHSAGMKTKNSHYPYLGMLSFLENISGEVGTLKEINDWLNKEKMFKWNKDTNFMMSVFFLLSEKARIGDHVTVGLNVSIESIIQAQQAAMIASISAATAASTTNG